MPTISMFFGIIIRMFFRDNKQHHLPHIHAEYQGEVAVFAIEDGSILDGSLPTSKRKLVEAWIEIHRVSCLPTGSWLSRAKRFSKLKDWNNADYNNYSC